MREEVEGEGQDRRPPGGRVLAHPEVGKVGSPVISKHVFFFPSTGRTFPTHPYFSVQLGAGQLSLFNLLKAYSLLDKEVGYCQGISFVAGVLLLHMSEEQAFEMLKFLMYDLGFRKQYRPDMMSLQVRRWLWVGQACRRLSLETSVPAVPEPWFRVQEI